MPSLLPTRKTAPTRYNPKILLIYGMPKVGKTTKVAELSSAIILDLEDGADIVECIRLPIKGVDAPLRTKIVGEETIATSMGLEQFYEQMNQYARDWPKGTPFVLPYERIVVDTLDKLEEFCEVSATKKYKDSTIGKKFKEEHPNASVLELPNGGGYYHLRNEMVYHIDKLAGFCKQLILVAHIREKSLNKGGIDIIQKDLSLAGKLSGIICAKADAVGYVYRETNKPMMISFETTENAIMGSRFPRLAGKRMPFEWDKIFITEEEAKALAEEPIK